MAEDAGTITRQALGRIAWLGDMYDARTDRFCAQSVFKETIPPAAIKKRENPHSNISFTTVNSVNDKLNILDVKADLKLSVLAGWVEVGGSARYLEESKDSFKSVESALVYNITTVVENIDLFNDELKTCFSQDALSLSRAATHVVVAIYWGANCTVTITDENVEDEDKTEVEASFKARLENLKFLVSPSGGMEDRSSEQYRERCDTFSLKIFGDILPDSFDQFPTTLDGAVELMRKIPDLVSKSNDGKGKPLKYVLFPLSSAPLIQILTEIALQNNDNQQVDQNPISYASINERQIIRTSYLFSYISELRRKAHDYYNELNHHCRWITAEEELRNARKTEEDLAVQEGRLKSDLSKCLKEIRSKNADGDSLEDLCKTHRDEANKIFQRCEEIYNREKQQIVFAKRCTRFGAIYLEPPIEEQIACACDKYENVYVLFDAEAGREEPDDRRADCETISRNHSTFIGLAKSNQHGSRNACYVFWPEKSALEESGGVRIEHHRRGKLIRKDVARDLEEMEKKNVANCPTARRPMVPFRVRCPGSFDGECSKEERSWTCINCKETLQLSLRDRTLCCLCGQAKASEFQFQCSSEAHGSQFMPFEVRCPGSSDGESGRGQRSWTCINCKESLQFSLLDGSLYCSCENQRQLQCRSQAQGSSSSCDMQQSVMHHHVSLFYKGNCLVTLMITFRASRRRREMYCGHARLCVFLSVCLSVCLSAAACPHYCTDPDVTWGER